MTVKELIEKLSELNPETKVLILGQGIREATISNEVNIKTVKDHYLKVYYDEADIKEFCELSFFGLDDIIIC